MPGIELCSTPVYAQCSLFNIGNPQRLRGIMLSINVQRRDDNEDDKAISPFMA